jgi:hypothetical protein
LIVGIAGASRADDFPKSIVSWEPISANPVFTGKKEGTGSKAWDEEIRERGWIVRDGKSYQLWYTGYNPALSPTRFLGHAVSDDGIHWTRDAKNPIFTGSWVEDVCLVRKDGIDYLFAEGLNDQAHLLTSNDGLHWADRGRLDIRSTDGRPIIPGPFGTPTVFVEGDTWYLFYERGDRGVWLATSKDHLVWTNVSDDPVLKMGPEPFDKGAVAFDQVLKRDGVFYAIYHAQATVPWEKNGWTTCVARSKDLIHWEKYPGNPILRDNKSSAMIVETPEGDRLYSMHPQVQVHVHPAVAKP